MERLNSENGNYLETLAEVLNEAQKDLLKPPSFLEDLRYVYNGLVNLPPKALGGSLRLCKKIKESYVRPLPRYTKIGLIIGVSGTVGIGFLQPGTVQDIVGLVDWLGSPSLSLV